MKLARILARRGDQLGCARELHEVPFWWPARHEASFLEAQAFKQLDRARDAEAAWRSCIAEDPLHPAPPTIFHGSARELVALYILEGRLDEARRTLWRAYDEATPEERPGVLAMRIRAELERIAHEEAVAKLRRYIEADPEDGDARRALALEEHAIGDAAGADRDLDAVLRERPGDVAAWRARLEILHQRGDLAASRSALELLPPAADGDAKTWMHRGLVRQSGGDHAGAFEAYRRSVELDPDDAEALYKLGMAEQRLGRAEEAKAHVARSRQLHQAYAKLNEAYQGFLEQARKAPRDAGAYRAAVGRLEEICRQLGWDRVADAWRRERDEGSR